nr:helix-turn-helix domain-containing protein [Methylobacterium sp. Leaf118]
MRTDYVPVTDPHSLSEAQARVRAALKRQGDAAMAASGARAAAVPNLPLPAPSGPGPEEKKERGPLTSETPIKAVIAEVASAFDVSYAEVVGPRRSARIVAARWACIDAVHRLKPLMSLPEIGRRFGDRDHTTILHAIRKMERVGVPQPPASSGKPTGGP